MSIAEVIAVERDSTSTGTRHQSGHACGRHGRPLSCWTLSPELVAACRCVVIEPTDMRDAQRLRRLARSQALARGAGEVTVIVDVVAVVAESARDARQIAGRRQTEEPGFSYAGTPRGLATLVWDICVAEVADAVRLTVLDADPEAGSAGGALCVDAVKALHDRGVSSVVGREQCPCDGIVRGRRHTEQPRV
ncbi:hypothetical protein [Gordonia polyisoprenivorans]|uniref:hypothetical protein n=1 Tax=Gordonia polyisoprenivorans TaxID=84595 RepID=UPI00039DBB02|nr:hypothetical protein [Gordonia polyisoprenivorans]